MLLFLFSDLSTLTMIEVMGSSAMCYLLTLSIPISPHNLITQVISQGYIFGQFDKQA
jgi:hypothetical protein